MKLLLFMLVFQVIGLVSRSQEINSGLLLSEWPASWIEVPGSDPHAYGVYYFRKSLKLIEKPDRFVIHVSADNRYKLYVNGILAGLGPARGERYHWNFETIDIARFLRSGENLVSAVVWNFGEESPEAQITYRTAFIVQGNGPAEQSMNTDGSWSCYSDSAYSPLLPDLIYSYYVAGPGEHIDFRKSPDGWQEAGFDDSHWKKGNPLFRGLPKGIHGWSTGWMLVPRTIPPMELKEQRFTKLVSKGSLVPDSGFLHGKAVTIQPGQKFSVLIDQGFLTNGYPILQFSGGLDAKIGLSYAEALYINEGTGKDWRSQRQKGNRNVTDDKRFVGVKDMLISSGKNGQRFMPLWWRTWRYLKLDIETAGEALVLQDLYSLFSGYPFTFNARFKSSDAGLQKLLETGWRTARACAMETYMDCPYYEQLQYVGDTRIQALVSLYNSGDDRLIRNAIALIDQSRMAEGFTLSRYPTRNPQEIPPFSLWWIAMLHDYYRYRPDAAFVGKRLPGMRQVLDQFMGYSQPDGCLKGVPYWNFTDWAETPGWNAGVAPVSRSGFSSILDFQFLWALQLAAELEDSLGMPVLAARYRTAAGKLMQSIRNKYYVPGRSLFADTEEKKQFSQHANALAILTGTVKDAEARSLADQIISDTSLTAATIYFQYYVHLAIVKAGMGDRYLDLLGDWYRQLNMGLTTWAEISDVNEARSDCHAWGASPNIELFRTVLGIDSDGPGFSRVVISPNPGKLEQVSGSIPHPSGKIGVSLEKTGSSTRITISLPSGIPGKLVWRGKSYPIAPGVSRTFNL